MTQRRSAPPKRRVMMDIRTLHVFSSIELAQLRQGVNNAARLSSLYLEQLVHAKICALVFHIIFVRPSVHPSIHVNVVSSIYTDAIYLCSVAAIHAYDDGPMRCNLSQAGTDVALVSETCCMANDDATHGIGAASVRALRVDGA